MIETILVPLDGSALAERAIPYATTLVRAAGGRLILLHVGSGQRLVGGPTSELRAVGELDAVADTLRGGGLEVEELVRPAGYEGAGYAIAEAARERGGNLIVMATHGRGGPGRWLYGSVADQVVRQAAMPLLLVPAAGDRPWPTDRPLRILVPLDGSRFAEEALGPAIELATTLGAELMLLQVVEPPGYTRYGESYYYIPWDEAAAVAGAEGYLEQLADRLRTAGRTVMVLATVGAAASGIGAAARDRGTDLIAMATHGRGGLARLVLGSVATRMVHLADVPLLLVRPAALRQPSPPPTADVPEQGPVTESSVAPPEPERVGPTVTVTLSAQDLELLRRGLRELLYNPGRDWHQARTAQSLLARLEAWSQPSPSPPR